MKKQYTFPFTIFLMIFLSSCATIFTGSKEVIHFESVPPGAQVSINGKDLGVTPLTVGVKRNLKHPEVKIELDGYKENSFPMEKKFNVISTLNLINVIGWLIDLGSGAVSKYPTHYYAAELAPADGVTPKPKDAFYTMDDNYYLITMKKDTFYCYPQIKNNITGIHCTTLNGEAKDFKLNEVLKYKALVTYSKSNFFDITYENVSENPKRSHFLQLLLENGEFKFMLSSGSGSGVMMTGGGGMIGGGGSKPEYFVYRGNKVLESDISKKKRNEILRKYFADRQFADSETRKKDNYFKKLNELKVN